MTNAMRLLLFAAMFKHGDDITPCASCDTWADCFKTHDGILTLYYNDRDGSTHIVREEA